MFRTLFHFVMNIVLKLFIEWGWEIIQIDRQKVLLRHRFPPNRGLDTLYRLLHESKDQLPAVQCNASDQTGESFSPDAKTKVHNSCIWPAWEQSSSYYCWASAAGAHTDLFSRHAQPKRLPLVERKGTRLRHVARTVPESGRQVETSITKKHGDVAAADVVDGAIFARMQREQISIWEIQLHLGYQEDRIKFVPLSTIVKPWVQGYHCNALPLREFSDVIQKCTLNVGSIKKL